MQKYFLTLPIHGMIKGGARDMKSFIYIMKPYSKNLFICNLGTTKKHIVQYGNRLEIERMDSVQHNTFYKYHENSNGSICYVHYEPVFDAEKCRFTHNKIGEAVLVKREKFYNKQEKKNGVRLFVTFYDEQEALQFQSLIEV